MALPENIELWVDRDDDCCVLSYWDYDSGKDVHIKILPKSKIAVEDNEGVTTHKLSELPIFLKKILTMVET